MTTAPVAVFAEPLVTPLASAAGVVRVTIASLLVAAAIVWASLQAFSLAYGVENRLFDGLAEAPAASPAAQQLVTEQQAWGLSCRTEPALTDQVVFQYGAGEVAAVLSLREAVAAHRAGAGTIQRYCS